MHDARTNCAAAFCCLVMGVIAGPQASAKDNCAGLSPGVDGVLRLDTGKAEAWPCAASDLPAYDALPRERPKAFELRAARPKAGPAQAPATARDDSNPAPNPPANDEALRLKDEMVLLQAEMARLRDEAAQLRSETARLKDQLARRDATVPAKGESKAESKAEGKVDSKIEVPIAKSAVNGPVSQPAPASAAKGDLLATEPQTSEIQKTPPDKKSEAQLPDEREFDRQKTVVERAWTQLIDLAARIRVKKELPGKPE
jgi:hypothetical protein